MAGVGALGEDMDEDEPVAGLDQVVDRPRRRGLAGRRVVHADANGALPGRHAGTELATSFLRIRRLVHDEGREKKAGREGKLRELVQEGRGAETAAICTACCSCWEGREFVSCSEYAQVFIEVVGVGVEPDTPTDTELVVALFVDVIEPVSDGWRGSARWIYYDYDGTKRLEGSPTLCLENPGNDGFDQV